MHVNRGLLGWGVFLIVLGAVPLAVRGGYLDADVVRNAWELWPLILIGIGVGLVLQRTPAAVVGGLIVAVTFGLIGGAVLATGISGGLAGCNVGIGSGEGTAFETRTGSLGPDARVQLDLNCGELTVTPTAGSTWTVAGRDSDGAGPDITTTPDRLRVSSRQRTGFGINQGGQRWQVSLPTDPTVDLSVSVNAGSARLDLSGAHVRDANVSVNAGDLRLDLSGTSGLASVNASANAGSVSLSLPAASMTGSVSANLGSLSLCVPEGVGLRLHGSQNALASNNFSERGLTKDGETWTTSGFDGAASRIELSTSANLGSITLNPEAGCD